MNHRSQSQSESQSAQRLLLDYVESGDREQAFARLVAELGGLVYSSAHRRTGCPQLAEEVAQNVFAVLARRAKSLRNHPSIVAWLYQTTRYQSARAMRTERRHRRKLDALEQELAARTTQDSVPTGPDMEPWRDALPELDRALDRLSERERSILVQRFFLGLRFREIAERTSKSDAACKMAVKRALDRLSRTLASRGVTLSATVLGSCLGAELGKAAPLGVLENVAPQALSAASDIGSAAALANRLQTMGALRNGMLVGASVLTLAVPILLWQSQEVNQLERELVGLNRHHEQSPAKEPSLTAIIPRAPVERDVVVELLATRDEPFDEESFLQNVAIASWSGDEYLQLHSALKLSALSRAELLALSEKAAREGAAWWSEGLAELLEGFLIEDDIAVLDRLVRGELRHSEEFYLERLERWAAREPEAALEWFAGLQEEGVFGKREEEVMSYTYILRGLVAQDPEGAARLMRAEPVAEYRDYMASQIAAALLGTGGPNLPRDFLLDLFIGMELENFRSSSFRQVVGAIRGREGAEAAAVFAESVESARAAGDATRESELEATEE